MSDLKRTIDDLRSKTETNETANRLEIVGLREELGRNKPLLFDYPIGQIQEFFQRNSGHRSANFTCFGINWSLAIQTTVQVDSFGQSKKFLSFILACFLDPKKYECQTYFELRLLNQLPSRVHKVMLVHYTFSTLNGFGIPTFISEAELFDGGYVQNNSIKAQIYLKVEKLTPLNANQELVT